MGSEKRIPLRQIVILEGKYDQIKLDSLVDTVIIKTDGFGIYRDKEKQKLIRSLAKENGAVIATDSDAAGFQIRGFLTSLLKGCEVFHLYIPDVYGKEKRKSTLSKEGKIGVEGISAALLRKALEESGALPGEAFPGDLTKADLFEFGLSGRAGSAGKRLALIRALNLPERLSTNALLRVLNKKMNREELVRFLKEIDGE